MENKLTAPAMKNYLGLSRTEIGKTTDEEKNNILLAQLTMLLKLNNNQIDL